MGSSSAASLLWLLILLAFSCGDADRTTPAVKDAGTAVSQEARPKEDLLAPIELEMADRFAKGESFENDAKLFDRLLEATREQKQAYPSRLWLLLFSEQLQTQVTEEWLQSSPRDQLALDYLTKKLDPAWSLQAATVARNQSPELREKLMLRANTPTALLPAYDAWVAANGQADRVEAWRGVTHVFYGSHEESRGQTFAQPALQVAREFTGGDITGKDLADVGTGSGPTLPWLRQAIGPDATLYAVEVDPFSLDLMEGLSGDLNVEPVLCATNDVRLPPDSVDIIVQTGVHLGSGLEENYEAHTLPWLVSMSKALRTGGILIIDDGDSALLAPELDMVAKVERGGFKLEALRKGAEHPRGGNEWIAIFRVAKLPDAQGSSSDPGLASPSEATPEPKAP